MSPSNEQEGRISSAQSSADAKACQNLLGGGCAKIIVAVIGRVTGNIRPLCKGKEVPNDCLKQLCNTFLVQEHALLCYEVV